MLDPSLSRRGLAALALAAVVLAAPASAQPPPTSAQPAPELLEALRAGGLVIFLRHPATDNDQADTDPLNLGDCSHQRQLSETGREQARRLGAGLRAAGVTVSSIRSSPFCRAKEAAELTGLGPVTVVTELGEGGLVVSPNENARRARALREMLAAAPSAGNTLLVSHRPNLLDAVGADAFTIGEGEVFIFRPQQGDPSYRLIGRIPADAWR